MNDRTDVPLRRYLEDFSDVDRSRFPPVEDKLSVLYYSFLGGFNWSPVKTKHRAFNLLRRFHNL